jgi:uncharacterized membrane protein YfcA
MSSAEILALALAALLAGAMNAVAGGGTVLTFPALILFGMPAIQANATSTFALLVGLAGSAFGYRNQMIAVRPLATRFSLVSIFGGLIGAILLTLTREEVFSHLVPFLLLFATILFLANNAFRRLVRIEPLSTSADLLHRRSLWIAIVFQFFVALYGGYFGAGIGILMLASLGILGMHDIHEMNALKTVLAALINLVASIYFVAVGLVIWPQAIVMTVSATAGYFLAAHVSLKIPQSAVRRIAAAIGLGISILMFVKEFGA